MTGRIEITDTVKKCEPFILLGLPTVLFMFSETLSAAVLTDLIVYKTCLVSLNINATDCMMLRTNSSTPEAMDLEAKVEPYASTIVMTITLIESLVPGVLSVFLGPWSDRGGRKPLLLAAFSGFATKFAVVSFLSNWNISPWYLVYAMIPLKIFGGSCTIRLALSCYITDTTAEKDRMVQWTRLDAAAYTAKVLGAFIRPVIYENYGYTNTFRIAAFCCTLAVVYTYFLIPESVKNPSTKSLHGLCKISFGKNLGTHSSVKGPSFHRAVIYLAIFTLTLNALINKGYLTTEFLFTRARLGWDVQHFSYFSAASTALRVTGLCIVSLRNRVSVFSEIPDTLLIVIGLVSALCGAITRSLTWLSWHMYIAVCFEIFVGITIPIMRSVISNFIPRQDIGKVFSLTTLLEILSLLGGTPLYTLIYSNYLPPIYPSPVYLLSICLYALLILCVTCMEILVRKSRVSPTYIAAAQEDLRT